MADWVGRPRAGVPFGVGKMMLYPDRQDGLGFRATHGGHNPQLWSSEPLQTALWLRFVRPGDVVLDIGAHVGFYTCLFSQLVGPRGGVVSYEPDPDNFRVLQKNVALNNCTNVRVRNMAVGNHVGTGSCWQNPKNPGDTQTYPSNDTDRIERGPTTFTTIDAEGLERVDAVKMDIQGSEPAALLGMVNTISRNPHMKILLEFWPWGMRRAGFSAVEVVKWAHSMGFMCFDVCERIPYIVRVEDDGALCAALPDDDETKYTTLLLL